MKKLIPAVFLVVALSTFTGCSSYMYGYTQREATNRYLLVDADTKNFGYKRIQYTMGFRAPLQGFIESHGLPDFIYEFVSDNKREGIKLYYISTNRVFIFVARDRRPDSVYLKEDRSLSEYEKATYVNLRQSKD